MANTGRKIDYRIRPAKNIERKMMRDILLRLSPFGIFSDYQYIGFGSKYFTDFIIMHKYLGIDSMISIEGDVNNRRRYRFNKPFECIDVKFGHSNEVLPTLNLARKLILWLDYDYLFDNTMLSDLATVTEQCPSGTVIFLSYNSESYKLNDLKKEYPDLESGYYRRKFEAAIGNEFIPVGFDERGWSDRKTYSKFLRSCIHSQLDKILSIRNIDLNIEDKLIAHQICFFDYSDGAPMSTIGVMITKQKESGLFASCKLDSLYFYTSNEDSYEIKVPNLTSKEVRYLMEKMPKGENFDVDFRIFAEQDVDDFQANYKYYPSFMEIDPL